MKSQRLVVATLVAAATLPSRLIAQPPPVNGQPPGGSEASGSANSQPGSTYESGWANSQPGSTYAASSSGVNGGTDSGSVGDPTYQYDTSGSVWTTAAGTTTGTGTRTRAPSSSSSSRSASAGVGDEVEVGDSSGSYGDWWVPDDPGASSDDWETRPLTWMGEFVPEWTDDMPYPALGTVFRPTYAGQKSLRRLRKFRFNDTARVAPVGWRYEKGDSKLYDKMGSRCPRRFCLNVTIQSDYGALTDFEAFVVDRFESKTEFVTDPLGLQRPMLLVRGQISHEELTLVFGDGSSYGSYSGSYSSNSGSYSSSSGSYNSYSNSRYGSDSSYESDSSQGSSSNYGSYDGSGSGGGWAWMSETEYNVATESGTSWLMYPRRDHHAEEIDVTMSFKQLYTLLPGYNATAAMLNSTGPFYSDDPNDQVVIRLVGTRVGDNAATSAMFPIVMNTTGSTLFDVEYATSLSDDERIVNVDIFFQRKRYSAIPPWIPGDLCEECKTRMEQLMEIEEVAPCLLKYVDDEVFRDLFDNSGGSWMAGASYWLGHVVDECFGWNFLQAASIEQSGSSQSDGNSSPRGSTSSSRSESVGWSSGSSVSTNDVGYEGGWYNRHEALRAIKRTDAAIRSLMQVNCSIGNRQYPTAAGLMNIFEWHPSRFRAVSREPEFGFFVELELAGTSLRTPTLSNRYSERQIERLVQSSIPNASDYNLDIYVRVGDNLELIAEIERQNDWIRQQMHGGSPSSSSSSSSSSFVGDAGSFDGRPDGRQAWRRRHDRSNDDAGSFDGRVNGHRAWRRRHDGSSDGKHYIDSSSSGDGMLGPDAGRHHHHDDTGKDLSLLYVPAPEYFVEVEFRNVSISPRVNEVFLENDGRYEYNYLGEWSAGQMYLKTVPLQLSSFEYVPPPEGLDLVWRDEEPTSDTCEECLSLALDCVFDSNCRFGLDAYLLNAFERINATDYMSTQIDVTDVFRTAKAYFPTDGYRKLSKLMTCIATRWPPCDLDYPRESRNKFDGSVTKAAPTRLVINPTTFEFRAKLETLVEFYTSSSWDWYYERGNASAFEEFLIYGFLNDSSRDEFYWLRGGAIFTYNMTRYAAIMSEQGSGSWHSIYNDASVGDSSTISDTVQLEETVQHWVSLGFEIEDLPMIYGAEMTYSNSWSALIVADRPDNEELTDHGLDVQWRRLRDWIFILQHSESGGSEGSYSAGSSDASSGWENHTTTFPASGNSICPECMSKLTACVSDFDCRGGVRGSVLPSLMSALSSQLNGSSEPQAVSVNMSSNWGVWMANFQTEAGATKFSDLVGCLSYWGCAVGYSANSSLPGSPRAPSTFSSSAETVVNFLESESIRAGYTPDSLWDGYSELRWDGGMAEFLLSTFNLNSTVVQTYKLYLPNSSVEYHLLYRQSQSRFLQFWDEGRMKPLSWTTLLVSLDVNARSVARALSGLLEWFDMEAPDGNSTDSILGSDATSRIKSWDPCVSCVDEIQQCMRNDKCRMILVDDLIPNWLTPTKAYDNVMLTFGGWWGVYTTNYYASIYTGDLTNVLANMQWRLQDEDAWTALVGTFHCLARESCDLKYMNEAVAAPATAHQPTTMTFAPANMWIETYPGTQVNVTFHDQEFTFARSADFNTVDDPNDFVVWLRSVLNDGTPGRVEPLVTEFNQDGQFREHFMYQISFGEFVGTPPTFSIGENDPEDRFGSPVLSFMPWQLGIRSVDVIPEWPKLVDLLSLVANKTPEQASDGAYACTPCQELRDACLGDYYCQFDVTVCLAPMLERASASGWTVNDITHDLFWNALPCMWTFTRARLLDLVRCASVDTGPGASCIEDSSDRAVQGSSAILSIQDANSTLDVHVGWDIMAAMPSGSVFSYYYNGDTNQLATDLTNAFVNYCSSVEVFMQTSPGDDLHHLTIVYRSLRTLVLPHLSIDSPTGIINSVDYSQKYTLQSTDPSAGAANPYYYWTQWLRGNTVT